MGLPQDLDISSFSNGERKVVADPTVYRYDENNPQTLARLAQRALNLEERLSISTSGDVPDVLMELADNPLVSGLPGGLEVLVFSHEEVLNVSMRDIGGMAVPVVSSFNNIDGTEPRATTVERLIEADRSAGNWYEQVHYFGWGSPVQSAVRGLKALREYVPRADAFMVGAGFIDEHAGVTWVIMPAYANNKKWISKYQERYKQLLGEADTSFVFDPGEGSDITVLSDTGELGIKDEWFNRGHIALNISPDEIMVDRYDVARGRIIIDHIGTYNWDGSLLSDFDHEYTGKQQQVITSGS